MSYVPPSKRSRRPAKESARRLAGSVGVNVGLPEPLHRSVKIACASRGITIEQAVREALDQWIGRGARPARSSVKR